MPWPLMLNTATTMLIISLSFCSTCVSIARGGIKRQRPIHQHLRAGFAVTTPLSSTSTKSALGRPSPHRHRALPTTEQGFWTDASLELPIGTAGWATSTAKRVVRVARPHRRARTIYTTVPNSALVGNLQSAVHSDSTAQNLPISSPPPTSIPASPTSPVSTPRSTPCAKNVVVVADAAVDAGDDLERCRRLADNLGVVLVIRGQEQRQPQPQQRGEEEEEERKGAENNGIGGINAIARRKEDCSFKFAMLFDKRGRLALDQPGSGFNPLVVDFSGGKTGHRSKDQQQGKAEQVVKAASLRKSRAGGSMPDATSKKHHQMYFSNESPSSSAHVSPNDGGGGDAAPLPLLWDLTAGLGTDAFLLAQAGWRVEMFERSPVVAALVQDALDRARVGDDEIARAAASRMSLTVADSIEVLETIGLPSADRPGDRKSGAALSTRPDVVYLDPMFSQRNGGKRKKSALVKKGMQMLQALLDVVEKEKEETDNYEGSGSDREDQGLAGVSRGDGSDGRRSDAVSGAGRLREGVRADEERKLFDLAISAATRKVVVKRPVHGEAIVRHVKPSHAVVSKNGRFDVYVVAP